MVDGAEAYRWPISSGRRGFETPTGSYRPTRLERHWYSRQYNRTPMPWAMFFHRGYAVHGTMEAYNLGHAVSHGCVRLRPDKAAILYSLMRRHGTKQHQGRGDERPAAGRAGRLHMADGGDDAETPLARAVSDEHFAKALAEATTARQRQSQPRTACATNEQPARARAYVDSAEQLSRVDEQRRGAGSCASAQAWLRGLDRKYGITR